MRVPVALREDGAVHYRDYRSVPHGLTLGATESGKSVYQRNLVAGLAAQDVALVGIDCKQGVELFPLARRFSALADNPDTAARTPRRSRHAHGGRLPTDPRRAAHHASTCRTRRSPPTSGTCPTDLRPVPVVVLVDEVAELALFATKDEEKRRDRIITALVRLAQLGRAAGIYLEICGQRFGSELGKGITMLRAQLTGRTAHRVNDESSANMAFGDIAPDAVLAAIQIPTETPRHRRHRRLLRRLGPHPRPAHLAAPGREHLQPARRPHPGPARLAAFRPVVGSAALGLACRSSKTAPATA